MVATAAIRAWFDFITRGEFSAESDETIEAAIETSRDYADEDTLGSGKYRDAVANHAAHLLKSRPPTGGSSSSGGGQIKRVKNQQREVEYFQATSGQDPKYQSTSYGQAYESILDSVLVSFEVI